MKNMTIKIITLTILVALLSSCSIFRATGRSVSAVGEGAGHAISGTGNAISNAANEGL